MNASEREENRLLNEAMERAKKERESIPSNTYIRLYDHRMTSYETCYII